MKIHGKSLVQTIVLKIPIFFITIMTTYIASYFILRDFAIYTQPCGKKEPMLAVFKYLNNYNKSYVPGIQAAKFSYFLKKKELDFYSLYFPLEKMEMHLHHFDYVTLSNAQIEEVKNEGEFYKAEFKEMRIYEDFDESKLKD